MLRNRFILISGAAAVWLAAVALTGLNGLPQSTALAQGKGVITQKAISLDLALEIAQAAIAKCRADNYHVSVHVMDASGLDKAALRDEGSGEVNFNVSRAKAYTALNYHRPSADMEKAWANMSPARIIPGTFGVAGGLPIKAGDEIIGAVGVGGAPGGEKDEACAAAGLAKVADQLK
jgi:uncharacterized protein GlcG (DUF336 family)